MTNGPVTAVGRGPVTERPAWKALEEHHRTVRGVHLRELFARDPGRGERLTVEAAGVYPRLLEEPDHRRDTAAARPPRGGVRPARAHRRHVPRRQDQRLGEAGRAPRRAARAPRRVDPGGRQERGARGACRARPDGAISRTASAAEHGRATRASRSATSSTSASAGPIWVRSWPTRRSSTTATAA